MEFKENKKHRKFWQILIVLIIAIASIELGVMICLNTFLELSSLIGSVVDAVLLVILISPILYLLVFKPLTREAKFYEEAMINLKESEEKYASLTENSPDCIKLFDLKGKLLFINKGGLNEHQLKNVEEAKKWDYVSSVIEEDRGKFEGAFKEAANGNICTVDIRHTHGGSIREECRETMVPVKDNTGKIGYVFGVSRDISDIRRLERTKDSLMQMVVHDLKNPLAIFLGSVDFLKSSLPEKLNQDEKDVLFSLGRIIAEMQNMLSNILDISKAEEGKLKLNYEELDLNIIIGDLVESENFIAQKEKVKISMDFGRNIPKIKADENILKRVLANLVSNALKFTASNSEVAIATRYNEENNSIVVGIKDEGPGVPDKYKDVIFEKFVQVENKSLKSKAGKGLGLTFCKLAVEAHGGKIWIESEIDKGTTFYFNIPIL